MADPTYPPVLDSYGKPLGDVPPIVAVVRQIDDILNSVVGLAPAEPILNIVRDVMPANVINSLTGVPKPSDIVNPQLQKIAADLREKVKSRVR